MIPFGFRAHSSPFYVYSFSEAPTDEKIPHPCSHQVVGPLSALGSSGTCRSRLLCNLHKGMATLSLVSWWLRKGTVDLCAARKLTRGHHIPCIAAKWGGECASSLQQGINGCSRIFWDKDALHLRKKNKHLLLREDLMYCFHMVIVSSYF